MDTKKLAEEFKKKPSGYDSDSHEVTIYENGVDDFISFLDAQGKLAELEGYLHDIERLGVLVVDRINPNETIAGCVVRLLKNQGKLAEGGGIGLGLLHVM